jgi:cytoskeleton protein RodZ
MSETREGEGAAFVHEPAANDGVTAGTLLRRAREAAGLHVAALAVSLKVPVRKLEALEEDRWDVLPDAVFIRALASSVCRTLKIDPQPVLDRLPQTASPRLVRDGEGINTPFRAPSDGAPPSWLDHVTKPVFLAVFALLLGALVLILLPSTPSGDKVASPGAPDSGSGAPVGTPPAIVPLAVETVQAPAPAAPAAPLAATTLPAAVPPSASAAPTSVIAADPATAASGIIQFRASGPSWVEVTDATGVVAMRKLLGAGETAGTSGALPLQVTIGRVDHTEVQVRGKPFDLKPVSKDNVARFDVK